MEESFPAVGSGVFPRLFSVPLVALIFFTGVSDSHARLSARRRAALINPASLKEWKTRLRMEANTMLRGQTERFSLFIADPATGFQLAFRPDRRYPAASVMKLGIMLALYRLAEKKKIRLDKKVRLLTKFKSSVDGSKYSVPPEFYKKCRCITYKEYVQKKKKLIPLHILIQDMIQSSSNLATNNLLAVLSPWKVRRELRRMKIRRMSVIRGLYDMKAFDIDRHNTLTARAVIRSLIALNNRRYFHSSHRNRMLRILANTEHRAKIPGHLPETALVAQKSGNTQDVSHDASIIYPPDGAGPYYLVIMTQGYHNDDLLDDRFAQLSRIIYDSIRRMRAQRLGVQ